jgi:hypothetical protein
MGRMILRILDSDAQQIHQIAAAALDLTLAVTVGSMARLDRFASSRAESCRHLLQMRASAPKWLAAAIAGALLLALVVGGAALLRRDPTPATTPSPHDCVTEEMAEDCPNCDWVIPPCK